jgi:HEAT repeat protein
MSPKQILALCAPDEPLETTVARVKAAMQGEQSLDIQMTNLLLGLTNVPALDKRVTMHVLEVLDRVSSSTRVIRMMGQLVRVDDPLLRSRAALLVSRKIDSMEWVFGRMHDGDPRVRANILEGLWQNVHPACAAVFTQYREDRDSRVAANAVYGSYLRGAEDAMSWVMRMATHPNPQQRASAAWLMGVIGKLEFADILKRMVKHDERKVKGIALKSLARINRLAGAARNASIETTAA